MKAIRIKTILDQSTIKFKELEEFQGKKAEIIVLLQEEDEKLEVINVAGAFKKFADPDKIEQENTIWNRIVKERHSH